MKHRIIFGLVLLACLATEAADNRVIDRLNRLIETEWGLAAQRVPKGKGPSISALRAQRDRIIADVVELTQGRLSQALLENLMTGPQMTIRSNWTEVEKVIDASDELFFEVHFVPETPFSKATKLEVTEPVIGRIANRFETNLVFNGETRHLQIVRLSRRSQTYREFLGSERDIAQVIHPGQVLLDEATLQREIKRIKRHIRSGAALFGYGEDAEATALATLKRSQTGQDVLVPFFWSRAGKGLSDAQIRELLAEDGLIEATAFITDLEDDLLTQTRDTLGFFASPDVLLRARSRLVPLSRSRQPLGVLAMNAELARAGRSLKLHQFEIRWPRSTLHRFGYFVRRERPDRFQDIPKGSDVGMLIRLAKFEASEIRGFAEKFLQQQYFFDLLYPAILTLNNKHPVPAKLVDAISHKFHAHPDSESPEWLWMRCQLAAMLSFTDRIEETYAIHRRAPDELDVDMFWSATEWKDIINALFMAGQQALKSRSPVRAGEILDQVLKLIPSDYLVHFYRAQAYLDSQQPKAALASFEKARSLTNDKAQQDTIDKWRAKARKQAASQTSKKRK